MKTKYFVAAYIVMLSLLNNTCAWFLSRRRSCSAKRCTVSSWSAWTSCSQSCGFFGTKERTRYKTASESCGGSCVALKDSLGCNHICCPSPCVYTYSDWGNCEGCGSNGVQRRTPVLLAAEKCNGGCVVPKVETRNCDTGKCCPVNCQINNWMSWSSCNAACEKTGVQTRSRTVKTKSSCNGLACPKLSETKTCNGPCCPRNCQLLSWTAWGSCVAPSGVCSTNGGIQMRSRRVTKQQSCGGTCGTLKESHRCTPAPIACKLSTWTSWTSCQPLSGICGNGTKRRSRVVIQQPYCSASCGNLGETSQCMHSCCPVNCIYTQWGSWSSCSNDCGTGMQTKSRQVQIPGTCGGVACSQSQLKIAQKCTKYIDVHCALSPWSAWSFCSTGCGFGTKQRTRNITQQSKCRGRKCGNVIETISCTSYRDRKDCQVGQWGIWGPCDADCAVGSRTRIRAIKTQPFCNGRVCPIVKDTRSCGKAKGGCEQICSSGLCSCLPGYISKNKTHCTGKNCGLLLMNYCPSEMTGTACNYPTVRCPGGSSTFPISCFLECTTGYTLIGRNMVTCQTSGSWSPVQSYCKRDNNPPSDIVISGTSVPENAAPGYIIGTISTVDSNNDDTHTYRLVNDRCKCFAVINNEVKTMKTFDFEALLNSYDITIRSTDSGIPNLQFEKTFQIQVSDVNEKPKNILLSNSVIDENSDKDTVVGALQTIDDDNNQTFVYTLLDTANGLFKLVGSNKLMTSKENKDCLSKPYPPLCPLNYEENSIKTVVIMSTDSGSPPKTVSKQFDLTLRDVNDPPFNLTLSTSSVNESAPVNTLIGNLSANDEETKQQLTFKLINNDNGNFFVTSDGLLYKALPSDYETNSVHQIEVEVSDSGIPNRKTRKTFFIDVIDNNEPPVKIILLGTSSSHVMNNTLTIAENTTTNTNIGIVEIYDEDYVLNGIVVHLDNTHNQTFDVNPRFIHCHNTTNYGAKSKCSAILYLRNNVNFENVNSYDTTLKIIDRGHTALFKFQIKVSDCNDKPTAVLMGNTNSVSVYENLVGVNIGYLSTVDEDTGQSYTYKLLHDFNLFEVQYDIFKFKDQAFANYENKSLYKAEIESTDNGSPSKSVTRVITINIADVNDLPESVTLSNAIVYENASISDVVGDINIVDEDTPTTDAITHPCHVVNNSAFVITNNVLRVNSQLNYERASLISLRIACTDKALVDNWTVDVYIYDVNEEPTGISLSNLKVKENSLTPTLVGILSTNDPDNEIIQKQSFNYTVLTNRDLFNVVGDKLYATKMFDYETITSIDVNIQVTDSGVPSKSYTEMKILNIVDVNDRPTDIIMLNNIVDENSPAGTVIGTLDSTDEDQIQIHKYRLIDSSSGRFQITGNTLMVAQDNAACSLMGGNHCKINFEKTPQLNITIVTTDNGSPELSFTKNMTIYLRDVNDKPYNISISGNTLPENAPIDYKIGKLSANDEDNRQILTFELAGGPKDHFYIDDQSILRKKSNFSDFETKSMYRLLIDAKDNGSPFTKTSAYLIIEILDVNEAPIATVIKDDGGQNTFNESNPHVDENSPVGTIIGTIFSYDEDYASKLNITFDDSSNKSFAMDTDTVCVHSAGKIKTTCKRKILTNATLNYETKDTHRILVRSTDSGGLHHVQTFTVTIVDLNDPPTDILLSGKHSVSFQENVKGAYIADISTVDEDQEQSYQYELQDQAKALFEIRMSNKLHLKNSVEFDYETHPSFNITIKSTDDGKPNKSVSVTATVNIENVNEAPYKIFLSNTTITENSPVGTIIGNLTIVDPDNLGHDHFAQTHTCSITGSHSMFHVTFHPIQDGAGKQNVLRVLSNDLDFEKASSYNVTLKCLDSGTPKLHLEKSFVISVTNVNEAPIDIIISSNDFDENMDPGIVGTLSTVDPDNFGHASRQSFTYTLLNTTVPFIVDGDQIKTTTKLDYELTSSYDLYIRSVDNGSPNLPARKFIRIIVVDINEAPTDILFSANTLPENSAKGTIIGSLSVIDEDKSTANGKQQHTYSLTANKFGAFRIAGNVLQVAEDNTLCLQLGGKHCKLNFEDSRYIQVVVEATDNGSPPQSFQKRFTVNLTDVNDKPRNVSLSSNVVPENASLGFVIGHLSVSDEDPGQKQLFSLADDDEGRFSIRNTSLIKSKPTNYESKQSHRIVIAATDDGMPASTIKQELYIIIQDINESPTNLRLTGLQASERFPDNQAKMKENSPIGTVVATVEADDQDAVKNLSFELLQNVDGKFKLEDSVACVNVSTGLGRHTLCRTNLLVNSTIDYEQEATIFISLRVVDPAGLSHVASFNITILDGNDAPIDVSVQGEHACFVQENLKHKRIGALETIDQDSAQDFSYKLLDSSGNRFSLQKDQFDVYQLYTTDVILDYENHTNYSITIETTDNGQPALSYRGRIIVQVIDVNEAPIDIRLTSNHIKENSKNRSFVSNVTVVDPDNKNANTQTHVCVIRRSSSKKFLLHSNQLILNDALDYEQQNKEKIRLYCVDSGFPQMGYEQDVTLFIDNINEPPTGVSITSATVPENKDNYAVGKFIIYDPDNNDNHTISLVDMTEPFTVDGLTLRTTRNLNYENQSVYYIDVLVTDAGGLSYTESFQITVEDRNDAPTDLKFSGSFTLPENSPRGINVGRCTAVDEDSYQMHKYAITFVTYKHSKQFVRYQDPSPKAQLFQIGYQTGVITYISQIIKPGSYLLGIKATDSGSPSLYVERNVTVYVTNVNERPTNILLQSNKIQENAAVGTLVGTLFVVDPDNSFHKVQNHSCAIKKIGSNELPFEVNVKNQVVVKSSQMLDFEVTAFFNILVECTEVNGQFSIQKKFVITVLNVNEAPENVSLSPSSIDEHNKIGDVVGVVKFRDPDNANTLTDNVTVDNYKSFGAPFAFLPPFSLASTQILDHETQVSYIVQVTLKDNGNPSKSITKNITIQVNDLNDAPTDIVVSTSTLKEDILPGSIVANLTTIDHDENQQHTYKILDSAGLFSVSGSKLTLTGKLDFESFQGVRIYIESTDDGSPPLSFRKYITFGVLDANDKPDSITTVITPVPENTHGDFQIANLHVKDEDDHQMHTCVCVSSNKDWIKIVTTSNGNISVFILADKIEINYEAIQVFIFEIRCFDDGLPKLSVDGTLKVPVSDVNESPSNILINNSSFVFVNENPIANADIGVLQCVDPDVGQTFSFELLGVAHNFFKILEPSNELKIINFTQLNYEAPPGVNQFVVDLLVKDNGIPQLSYKGNITIIAKDVNEPPTNITLIHGSHNIKEDSTDKIIGELWSANPEGMRQRVTFQLLNYQQIFRVVTAHAPAYTSYVHLIGDLHADERSTYELSIQATDDGNPPMSTIGVVVFYIIKSNPCLTKNVTCQKNSICQRVNKTHTKCKCLPGFSLRGNVCMKIDDCRPQCQFCVGSKVETCNKTKAEPCSPCQNGGLCTDRHLNYSCKCEPGFTGHDCSININDCQPNPCLHNSTCYDGTNNFTCVCAHGFRGRTCDVNIDECEPKPCFKGACTDLINGYKCACLEGYFGSSCERGTDGCAENNCRVTEICTVIDISKNVVKSNWRCVPKDETVTLAFPSTFAPLSGDAMILWKLHFEQFLKTMLTIPLPWLQPKSGYKDVYLTDAVIISYEPSPSKSYGSDSSKTDVEFFGAYQKKILPPNVLLFSINETCEELFTDCTIKNNQFGCRVCSVVNSYLLENSHLKKPVAPAYTTDNDPAYMTVLPLVGIVVCVLVMISIAVFVYRNRRNRYKRKLEITSAKKAEKRGKHLQLEKRSSSYNDYDMDNFDGHFNPIYGIDEEDITGNEGLTCDPLHDDFKPDDLFSSSTKQRNNRSNMFENPLYGVVGINGTCEETAMNDGIGFSEGIVNPFFENTNIEVS